MISSWISERGKRSDQVDQGVIVAAAAALVLFAGLSLTERSSSYSALVWGSLGQLAKEVINTMLLPNDEYRNF